MLQKMMSNYQERFVILIFTILSTIFILGCFISSSSYSKLTATPPTIRGQYFLTSTQRTEFEKSQIMNELPPKKPSNVSEKKMWKILWYNIPFYLVPYLRKSQKKKCLKTTSTCTIYTDVKYLNMSDVVIFSHTAMPSSPPAKRNSQIWCFNSLETRALTHHPSKLWKNKFEWIMSYRRDANIVRSYGKIFRKKDIVLKNFSEVMRQKTKFGVWMSSHCPVPSRRKAYIEELQKYIPVDTFGSCGKRMCGTRSNAISDCLKTLSNEYKFYFSFENNICRDYTTEKLFNLFIHDLNIIPVVNGPPQVSEYLPNGTFLSAMDFSSPKALADRLRTIASNDSLYLQYLKEKDKYSSFSETEIFGQSMCDICEKLDRLNGRKPATRNDLWEFYKNEC